MIPLFAIGFVVAAAVSLITLWPLLDLKPANQRPRDQLREFERLLFEKERYLTNLQDLELDHQMKKISGEDYDHLRSELLSEAGVVYAALEKIEKENPFFRQMEHEIVKRELLL